MVAELKRLDAAPVAPDLERAGIVETYEEVFAGRRRRFPNNFFNGTAGHARAGVITRYLLEEKLGIRVQDIPRAIHKKLFYDNGLTWMLGSCFDWSPYKAIDNAYPGLFHKWQFNVKGMWQGPERLKLAAEATRWMIEHVEGVAVDEIPQRISATTFGKYNLSGMLSVCFKGSFFRAIENAYPGRFHPWEFRNVPKNFWQGGNGLDNARRATRWLCEEKLGVREGQGVPGRHVSPVPRARAGRHADRLLLRFIDPGAAQRLPGPHGPQAPEAEASPEKEGRGGQADRGLTLRRSARARTRGRRGGRRWAGLTKAPSRALLDLPQRVL